MSQNRTIIQGMNDAEPGNFNPGGGQNDFYQRGSAPRHGTVVTGMVDNPTSFPNNPVKGMVQRPNGAPILSDKPIVGFLYSVSRVASGEYWPLHIGQNTIGKASNCNVVLPEGTISDEHAVLMVRKNKNPEKVIASITDARSTNGTMLNGVSLEFEPRACANGDIITIGDNYELLLLLVDAPTLGLKPSTTFIPIEEQDDSDPFDPFGDGGNGSTRPGGGGMPFGGSQNFGGTVGYDGNQTAYNSGGTVGL